MGSPSEGSAKRARRAAKREEEAAGGPSGSVAPVEEIAQDIRAELQALITEIIFKSQEVGFALAELECGKRGNCALVEATKGLVSEIKRLFHLQRAIAKQRATAG